MYRNTYFIDIDGTILEHLPNFLDVLSTETIKALPQAAEKIMQFHCRGDMVILTTARPESLRKITEIQLANASIAYDRLIMGIGQGRRIVVNDVPEGIDTKATAYNVLRNVDGLSNVI